MDLFKDWTPEMLEVIKFIGRGSGCRTEEVWSRRNLEERASISRKALETKVNKSSQEVEEVRKRQSDSLERYWKKLDLEGYQTRCEAISRGMTLEVRLRISASVRAHLASLDEEALKEWTSRSFRNEESEGRRRKSVERFFDGQSYEAKFKRIRRTLGSPESHRKRKETWAAKTPEEKSEIALRIARSNQRSPSYPEVLLGTILEGALPGFWAYNGDGQKGISIGGKIPDFVPKEGNKIIEVFGTYWHGIDEEKNLIDHYRSYGYECLVVWEDDCYLEDEVLLKLRALNWI